MYMYIVQYICTLPGLTMYNSAHSFFNVCLYTAIDTSHVFCDLCNSLFSAASIEAEKKSKFINNSARVLCASLYVLNFLLDNSNEITKEIVSRDEYFVKTYNLSDLSVCNQTRNGRFVTLQRNVTVVM
jgi:hypothetical protein